MQVFATDGEPRAHEALGTLTASIGFTSTYYVYGGLPMKAALLTGEDADIRFCIDGTTPVVTGAGEKGHIMSSGQSYVIRGYEACRNFRMINAVNSNGATAKATYFY
jgi:hypothetical protein